MCGVPPPTHFSYRHPYIFLSKIKIGFGGRIPQQGNTDNERMKKPSSPTHMPFYFSKKPPQRLHLGVGVFLKSSSTARPPGTEVYHFVCDLLEFLNNEEG